MKKYICKILLFVSPVLIVFYPLDYFLSDNLRKTHDYLGECEIWNDIFDGNINADIAIYGSSRAWTTFDTKIFEDSLKINVYNFGMDGHQFWLQYFRHKEYLKYNKPPAKIILAIDVQSLQKREDLYNYEQFLPYMLWNKDIEFYTSSFKGFGNSDYYIPLIRYFGKFKAILDAVKNFLFNNPEKFRYKGFQGQNLTWDINWREKAQLRNQYYTDEIDSETYLLFKNFIEECKAANIELILVWVPEYVGGWEYIKDREKFVRLYDDLAQKYELPYLNYSTDTLSHDTTLFYNATHLNSYGAEIFTNRLIKDLQNKNDK
jgi:hypothetical protein